MSRDAFPDDLVIEIKSDIDKSDTKTNPIVQCPSRCNVQHNNHKAKMYPLNIAQVRTSRWVPFLGCDQSN